ncbi:phosphoglycerate kinase [Candidatus Roizmanbacteria bacterium]|nr:phosphoglycerate kinase [Candidatus Roizmanbacteria bacterium]
MRTITQQFPHGKRVLLRADFDVSLNPDHTIANDARIQSNLPTIQLLLKNKNKLVCVAKLDRPKGRDLKYSLSVVVKHLQKLIPTHKVRLIDDFLTVNPTVFDKQTEKDIYVLENIRFYPEEKKNDATFAKRLADLADVYVNDAFAMCHRSEASIVGVTKHIPSYSGLLLKKEIEMIDRVTKHPHHPVVVIIGGAKVSTKIHLIGRLMEVADCILIGGGLANTFFAAQNFNIGGSFYEKEALDDARQLLQRAKKKHTDLLFPVDVVLGSPDPEKKEGEVVNINDMVKTEKRSILDIGPQTQALFGSTIAYAKTIIWNGPMGYIEHSSFRRGTDFVFYAIAQNQHAVSLVGGGDTLAAISKKEYIDQITHVSTGGGAMLEYIEKGTLPGIEALNQ